MDVFQFVLAILAVVAPVIGGLGYATKRYSDGKYRTLESRLRITEEKAAADLESMRAESAQALAASKSIETLTGALMAMVDERRESTLAIKENTVALLTMSAAIEGMNKERSDGVAALTTAMATLTDTLNQSLPALVIAQAENTDVLKRVATGQDDVLVLFEAFELILNRLKADNKRFAAYLLRPLEDANRQGIEDIASGKPDEPAAAAPDEPAAAAPDEIVAVTAPDQSG